MTLLVLLMHGKQQWLTAIQLLTAKGRFYLSLVLKSAQGLGEDK